MKLRIHNRCAMACLLLAIAAKMGAQAVSYGGIGDPSAAPGDPASSYALSGLDHVNHYNGLVNLTIPIHSIGGRGTVTDNIVIPIQRQWAVENVSGSYVPSTSGWPNLSGRYTSGFISFETVSGNANQCVTYDGNGNVIGYSQLGPFTTYIVWNGMDGTQTILRDLAANGQPKNDQVQTCGQTYTPFDRGRIFQSSDGADLTFVADADVFDGQGSIPAGVLTARDGTKYYFSGDTYVSKIEDRNGNLITFAFSGTPSGGLYTVTDPVGLTQTINFTEDLVHNTQDIITYPGANGSTRTVAVNYALLQNALAGGESLQTYLGLFPELNGSNSTQFNPYVISSVTLADGRSYTIRYNAYGEPASLTLPSGGVYTYKYPEAMNGGGSGVVNLGNGSYGIYRRVQERDEYADGSNLSGKILFSAADGPADPNPPYSSRPAITATGTFEDAQGNTIRKESHFFYGNPAPTNAPASDPTQFAAWWLGLEWQTQVFTSPFANAAVVVQRLYNQRSCPEAGESNCWFTPSMDTSPSHDTHVCLAITTLDYLVQSATAYTYDQFNNLTDQYDFTFGAVPALTGGCPPSFGGAIRHTNTSFLTGNYTAPGTNIVGLPSEVKIADGAGNVYSDTKYGYDENSMTNCGGIVGHDNQNYAGGGLRGNLTSILQYSNTAAAWLTSTLSYDIAGNVVNLLDANGHNTWFSYTDAYPDGGRNTYAHAATATNQLQQVQSWTYDYGSGQVLTATNANNGVTHYTYNDPLDRLTNVSNPDGSTNAYAYPSATDVHVYQDQDAAHAGVNGLHAETLYDGLGRLIESRQYESASGYISTAQSYDALGRIATRSNPFRPGDGLNFSTSYSYDALGRSVRVTTPDGAFTTSYYSGNTAILTDEAGNQRMQTMDGLGRLTDVYEDPYGANFHTSYALDPLNNVRTLTQGTQTRSYVYDSLSRLTSANNPESGTVSYAYDNVGNLVQRQDGRGVISHYTYDELNRQKTASYSDGTPAVSYSYDNAGANSIGQLTSIANGISTTISTTYYTAFDAMGRVTASNQQTQGQTYAFAYGYNLAGALTSETYPSGRVVTTSYDGANRASTVAGQLAGAQTSYVLSNSYQPQGAPNQTRYGNQVVRTWRYDNRLRPIALWDAVQDDASQFLFLEYPAWNTNGTMASKAIYAGGPAPLANLAQLSQSFTHDSLKRLTFASDSGGWWQIYNYDQYGNMWIPSSSGLPANGAMPSSNLYNGKNQNPNFAYDAAGNQTIFGSLSLSYDAENRQTAATNAPALGGGTAGYQYDGAGRRVAKVLLGGTTVYVYDALGQLAEEYSTASLGTSPCATCFLSVDHLGSTRMVTDLNANVVARHDFAPFGQEIPTGSLGRSTLWAANDNVNQKFTGQERDSETTLDFFQARYMASSLGRFMSADPDPGSMDFANPQSFNRYSYVLNNPLALVDPSGTDGFDPNPPGDPCDGDPFCGGSPWDPFPPASNPSPAPPSPVTVEEPVPPGSFPGGETLGLPPGLSIPGPFGIDTGCDFGPCGILPGLSAQQRARVDAALAALAADFWRGIKIWINGRPAPGDPYETRLFGTHWCGPGGAGPTVNNLDRACQVHDYCYESHRLSVSSNFNLHLSPSQRSDLQQCNQTLCNASRSVLGKDEGGAYVNWYFGRVLEGTCH